MSAPTMTTTSGGGDLPAFVTGPKASGWWAIFMLMLIESAVFVGLISSYFYLFANATVWPPDGTKAPSLGLPLVYTAVLLISAVCAFMGNRAIAHGNVDRLQVWRAAGVICLILFLAMKAYEYATLDYQWDESAYTSIVWLIAGFHSAHVLTVVLKDIPIQVLAWKGFFNERRRSAIEGGTMYWIFVVAWWLPLFAAVYLFPNFA